MNIFKIITDFVDSLLNKTPMYKVVLYSLIFITLVSFVESYLGLLSYTPESLFVSLGLSLIVCLVANFAFAKIFKLPLQHESSLITALIIFLIMLPYDGIYSGALIVLANFLAIASKYLVVARNTHIFNPASFGIFAATMLGSVLSGSNSFWWVGSLYLLPVVLLTGLVVVRKTRREAMFNTAIVSTFFITTFTAYYFDMSYLSTLYAVFVSGPIIFFASFMLTEPHTITKNKSQQIFYGLLVVIVPALSMFTEFYTIQPEFSLLIANIISFVISQRRRFVLKLKEIKQLNEDTFEYIFSNAGKGKFNFKAGEFMEWDLNHTGVDSRGMRRYFTISSIPNQEEIAFATKFPKENESSYKHALKNLKIGDTIYATQLGGDFLLENTKNKNIIMVAGGIGITPFISQLRDLLETKKKQKDLSIALFYCVNSFKDIVFGDVLTRAVDELGLKLIYVVSKKDENDIAKTNTNSYQEYGYMSKEILNKYTQNLHNEYYISGPNIMVTMIKKSWKKINPGIVKYTQTISLVFNPCLVLNLKPWVLSLRFQFLRMYLKSWKKKLSQRFLILLCTTTKPIAGSRKILL